MVEGQYTVFNDQTAAKDYAMQQSNSTGTPWSYSQQPDGSFRAFAQYQVPAAGGTATAPATRDQYANIYPNSGAATAPTTPPPSNDTGGIDLKDRNANPGPNYFWDAADGWKLVNEDAYNQQQQLADQYFTEGNSYLNEAENSLRSQLPDAISAAKQQYDYQKGLLEGKNQQAMAGYSEQDKQAYDRRKGYESQSRQLYNELTQGIRQRFGGSTSAGQAASEINARETQKRFGDIATQYETAKREIGLARQNSENEFQNGLVFLEQQKQIRINEINSEFQNKLLEIMRDRTSLAQARTQMKMDLLSDYRNQLFQLQVSDMQFKQQLVAQKEAYDQQLSGYESNLGQYIAQAQNAGSYQTNTGTQTSLTLPGESSAAQYNGQQYTGQINDDKGVLGISVPNFIKNLFFDRLVA